MIPAIIISGFKRSGIYPFNPEALQPIILTYMNK